MSFIRLILFTTLFIQFSFGNDIDYVKDIFNKKIDGVVATVSDKNISKILRNEKIVEILNPIFDFELMAKLSLGRSWMALNDKDQEKFIKLYVERMKNSYSSKLDSYSGQEIKITNIKQLKSNRIHMESNLVSDTSKFEVRYKFYKPETIKPKKEKWLIYDVEVEGVSILKTDRVQFKEYLQTHTITELMHQLAAKP